MWLGLLFKPKSPTRQLRWILLFGLSFVARFGICLGAQFHLFQSIGGGDGDSRFFVFLVCFAVWNLSWETKGPRFDNNGALFFRFLFWLVAPGLKSARGKRAAV